MCVGGMVRKRQGSTYGLNSRGWNSELPHDMADKNKMGETHTHTHTHTHTLREGERAREREREREREK